MQSATVSVLGRRIHYRYSGDPANPPLVIIHGWGMDSSVAGAFVAYFTDRYFVVIPDLPGHGKSDSWIDFRFGSWSDWLSLFLGRLQLKRITLFAHSMGGGLATVFGALYPEYVERLVLVNTCGTNTTKGWWSWIKSYMFHRLDIVKSGRKEPEEIGKAFMANLLRHPKALLSAARMMKSTDLSPYLPTLRTDMLVIWTERDRYFPPNHFFNQVPTAQTYIVPDSGHEWLVFETESAANLIRRLLMIPPG